MHQKKKRNNNTKMWKYPNNEKIAQDEKLVKNDKLFKNMRKFSKTKKRNYLYFKSGLKSISALSIFISGWFLQGYKYYAWW